MAFDQTFLLALAAARRGFRVSSRATSRRRLAPSIRLDDEARRTRGFTIFSMAINFGAVVGPLVCGLLAQVYGWHYGFGLAAIFMLADSPRTCAAIAICPRGCRGARETARASPPPTGASCWRSSR